MTPDLFDQTLRGFLKADPFEPFVVELLDGRVIEVDRPAVAFGGGTAGFLSEEQGLVDINHEEVRAIRPTREQAVS